MHPFLQLFRQRLVYFDGGLGTTLQAMGLRGGEQPERWNLTHPTEVKSVYRGYLDAGSDMVAANTFGANPLHFPQDWETVLRAGLMLAREAAAEAGHGFVALDAGSVGKLLKPLGELGFEEAVTLYRAMALTAIDAGCDLLLAETMTDLREIKAAVLGYREALAATGADLPVLVSMSFDVTGRLLTGSDIEGAAAMLTAMEGVDALGMNCGREPRALLPNLKRLLACAGGKPVFFMPNASVPKLIDGKTVFATVPEEFAADMLEAARMGARGLGGCCGTNTAHIRALVAATRGMTPVPIATPDADGLAPAYISGRSGTLALGVRPVVIGERLNPTGKKRMKQALRDGDTDYLLSEATAQLDAGADALDVNVGLPELNEAALLPEVTEAVQSVAGVPLQLDTSDPVALEAALRAYVGKPIINSVNGKRHVMDEVFPLARRYGGALVCLALDEEGIPPTAEGRIAVARRMIAEAERYGIPRRDLLFDALTMTVATDPTAARVTLDTLRRLRDELRVKTVLGVSNVSFGLPRRPVVTAAFLAMALESGLSAAIINPLDEGVRQAFEGASAALGYDEGFQRYLARYGGGDGAAAYAPAQPAGTAAADGAQTEAAREAIRLAGEAIRRAEAALKIAAPAGGACNCAACAAFAAAGGDVGKTGAGGPNAGADQPAAGGFAGAQAGTAAGKPAGNGAGAPAGASADALFQAIVRGLAKAAAETAEALMDAGAKPLSVVETGVIPALSEVGARYERGEFFLPQLMQSAAAAKQAIAAATARMPDAKPAQSRTVLLATVHGDVHDIGKNIVATLLGSYGFGVIDLGRDVPPERVVEAARESGVRLVGLSALMTTTVPAMRETIELLRRELPQVKIMVGGAVLTPELALELGADGYAADAMGSVRYAGEVLDG
ncbi:MAG: dihydropteroate synthase [Clostridiales bacterium]|nr:dihydropteroate synthase [Clostridiales bacterium]